MDISVELQELLKQHRELLQDGYIRVIYEEIESHRSAGGIKCAGELTELLLNSGVDVWEYFGKSIPYGAFYKSRRQAISIPPNIEFISTGAFEQCTNLESIHIPDSVVRIGDYAFGGCKSLKSISIPDSVIYMGDGVFNDCVKLEDVVIGNNVKSIGSIAFVGCDNLARVVLGKNVVGISDQAFYYCVRLADINIPASVTHMGAYIFSGCASLREISYGGTREQWKMINRSRSWASGSAIKVIKCTNGDIQV